MSIRGDDELRRELERLREENESLRETAEILADTDTVKAIVEGETDAELTALRADDEKAAAVVQAWDKLTLRYKVREWEPVLGYALDELARAHGNRGQAR